MFVIKERALRAFTEDICRLTNEQPTEKTALMIRAISEVVKETGVGQEPSLSEDDNFMEYMQALSMGVTRLFKTPKKERLKYIHDVQRRLGLPLLLFSPPANTDKWIHTELDCISTSLFEGEISLHFIVHRPVLPPTEEPAACLYTSGDITSPAIFKQAAKGASTIIGRKVPLVPSAVHGCPPFYGRSVTKNRRREEYVSWRSGLPIPQGHQSQKNKSSFSDKMRLRIWNTATSISNINELLHQRATQDIVAVALGRDPTTIITEVPLLVAQMLMKYTPTNSISRSKPTVRLKNCMALLLN